MDQELIGKYEDRFTQVADQFRQILKDRPNSGAGLSIWKDGKCVVDLYGGYSDFTTRTLWASNTPTVIFSSTKGITSILVAKLFQDKLLDYEESVTTYWPEYGVGASKSALVKHLLSHRAGLPILKDGVSTEQVLNWKYMIKRLESESPIWEPGTNYFYHSITHGWLAGELIFRLTGISPGQYLQSVASIPLNLECWIGIPQDFQSRVANLYTTESLRNFFIDLELSNTLIAELMIQSLTLGHAFPDVLVGPDIGFNDPRVQAAEILGAGGISTANSLAKLWSATVVETEGVRLLNDETIEIVTKTQSEGTPYGSGPPPYSRFGMGFQLDSDARRYLSDRSFGHDGAGGQCSFADPVHKIGFAFVTNEMDGSTDLRATSLIDSLKACLVSY